MTGFDSNIVQSTADDGLLSAMARTNANNIQNSSLEDGDKQGLRAMLAQMDAMGARIRHLLGEDSKACSSPTYAAQRKERERERASISTPESVDLPPICDEPSNPVTEPTPPSTIGPADGTMDLD